MPSKHISILGTRGIPAGHGGFETFAERLALYLTERGWNVTVYCQGEIGQQGLIEDSWRGIHRIVVPVSREGAFGTVEFDWRCVRDVVRRRPPLVLTLGYNTALFCTHLRWHGITNLINMDGLEWRREKWRMHERAWLWLNERIGCWTGNHLIADHPAIAAHLATRVRRSKIATIPYGADRIHDADSGALHALGVGERRYGLVIARPEPENSVLDIVRAFSRRRRDARLVVLGKYDAAKHPYHRDVLEAASEEVVFPGAIYDQRSLQALPRALLRARSPRRRNESIARRSPRRRQRRDRARQRLQSLGGGTRRALLRDRDRLRHAYVRAAQRSRHGSRDERGQQAALRKRVSLGEHPRAVRGIARAACRGCRSVGAP
jgi:hypothetical protein